NPKSNSPLALTGFILICLIIYLMLQVAFIGALPSRFLAHGWHQLNFTSPLAQLMLLLNLIVFAIGLYIDAAISPSGTATVYA
ncbi:APC family permease, partial [Francisella tularensis subsp. holarctica]|nr:APC family permease [Francisella tularensis subsp. holarctica]